MDKDPGLICICGATPLETLWLKRGLTGHIKWKEGPAWYQIGQYMGERVILVQSGIGGKNIRRALQNLPKNPRIKLAFNIGCTGALVPSMKTAHLNVSSRILLYTDNDTHYIPEKDMLDLARSAIINFKCPNAHFLPSMTVKGPFDREDKMALHKKVPDLGCVDLESYYFAQFFARLRIPYLIARSVSDTWNLRLPPSAGLNPFWWKRKRWLPAPVKQLPDILRFHLAAIMACRKNQKFAGYLIEQIRLLGQ